MAGLVDTIRAFHNAFRRDMATIDAAALGIARGEPGHQAAFERLRFFDEMLVWHAHGEELAIFPALDIVAPLVSEAYLEDHHGLDRASEALSAAVSAGDTLQAARASAAFKFHLDIHLKKEDAHVYRLIRERVSAPDQGKALGLMSSAVPQARFPEAIAWLFPLVGNDDRENVLRTFQMAMPAPVFAMVTQLARQATGADDWAEMVRRVPGLA
jgi:hypothetical protein